MTDASKSMTKTIIIIINGLFVIKRLCVPSKLAPTKHGCMIQSKLSKTIISSFYMSILRVSIYDGGE